MTAGTSQLWRRTARWGLAYALAWTLAVPIGVAVAPEAVAADVRSKQWYLDAMHAEEIWKKTTGEGIKVAVIDSGVNPSTQSLKGQILKGFDASGMAGDETDDYEGHGTTMAELIAGTGKGGGLRGLAPGVKIIPMRISDTERQNKGPVNASDAPDAIRAAADSDAQIISMSFGSEFSSPKERQAVKYAQSKGKLFFAAAGNSGHKDNKPNYPANYDEVVAVSSTDSSGTVSDHSQHGDNVDIAAPGSDIPSWCDTSFTRYCDSGGTSAATALASASAALIWSLHPDWTANQVLRVMFESAARDDNWKPGTVSTYLGHGIVRPNAHISRGIGKPGAADISPLTNKTTNGSGPSGSPAPSASAAPQAPKPGSDAVAAGSSGKTEDDGQLLMVLGGAAAVVVLAGVVFAVLRRRRSA
ncbi:S8 family serine peptidase [Streptomyces sp. NPDC059828]|uniref:S8 family serine peptidase n=1 Tax=Streptomyces sp. NPDC059828 TaxID=3346965 RepID=UPI003664ED74